MNPPPTKPVPKGYSTGFQGLERPSPPGLYAERLERLDAPSSPPPPKGFGADPLSPPSKGLGAYINRAIGRRGLYGKPGGPAGMQIKGGKYGGKLVQDAAASIGSEFEGISQEEKEYWAKVESGDPSAPPPTERGASGIDAFKNNNGSSGISTFGLSGARTSNNGARPNGARPNSKPKSPYGYQGPNKPSAVPASAAPSTVETKAEIPVPPAAPKFGYKPPTNSPYAR